MSFQGKLSYGSFVVQTLTTWTQIRDLVMREPTSVQLEESLERLNFLSGAIASWPAHALELRHQHSLLILIDDTILWVEALVTGGDDESAVLDMSEAVMSLHVEVDRLVRARRDGQS